jgi:signal transduction histidine kinase/CheY-like chemotaxis protein
VVKQLLHSDDSQHLLAEIDALRRENLHLRQQPSLLRNQLQAFMDGSPATAWIKNSAGALIYVNQVFKQFIDDGEFPTREWHGKTDDEIWDEQTAMQFREADLRVLRGGVAESQSLDLEHSDGTHHWLAHRFRFQDGDGEYCLGCLGFDLTEQVMAEKHMQDAMDTMHRANTEKAEFLSLVSHELRTPMHSILASAERWKDEGALEPRAELVSYINYGVARLRSQVDNLSALAETDTNANVSSNTEFNVQSLVQHIANCTHGLLVEAVNFSISQDENVPVVCAGNPHLIEQVVRPVLENSLMYTEMGHINLLLGWDPARQHLVFTIEDSGCGLSTEKQKLIFKDALAVSEGMSRGGAGVGIGLTICYRLCDVLNAELALESEAGVGTRVKISVPVSAPDQATATPEAATINKGSILVIEPDAASAELLASLVNGLGFEVDCVTSGEAALQRLHGREYCLIFMAMDMPIMDGVTATRWIRRRGVTTRIVAMSDGSKADIRRRSMEHGVDDFLVRPVRRGTVFRLLERQLPPEYLEQ